VPEHQHPIDPLSERLGELTADTRAMRHEIGELRTELRELHGELRTLYRFVIGNTLLLVLAIAGAVTRLWHG
jgi:hypothetical protein